MKKRLAFLLALGLVAFIPFAAQAFTSNAGKTITVGSSVTTDGVYAAGGGSIDLSGLFHDDVIVAGGQVTITGTVDGDVIVAGGDLKITGEVKGNVRAAGGTIEIDGKIGRNLLVAGGQVTVGSKADIAGEAMVTGGDVSLAGHVVGDVSIWGGSIMFNASTGHNVRLHSAIGCKKDACLTLGSDTNIAGDLEYWTTGKIAAQSGVQVHGKTTPHNTKPVVSTSDINHLVTAFRLWGLFSTLLIGILIALFVPGSLRRVNEILVQQWKKSILTGAIVFFLVPIAIVLFMVTVVGIPLAVLTVIAYALSLYVTPIILGYYFGLIVLHSFNKKIVITTPSRSTTFWATVIGMIMFSLIFTFMLSSEALHGLGILSALGGIIHFALTIWALGGLALYKWSVLKRESQ